MNPTTKPGSPANHVPVSLMNGQTPDEGFPIDFQDLLSLGMDQALGIEKAFLNAVVCWSSCAIDIYKNAFWLTPAVRNLFDTSAQSFSSCMEMQMNWLTLLIPASPSVASPSSSPSADELAHCMDIAIGEQPPATASSSRVESGSGITVASSSGTQVQPDAEVSETDMDIAIGERKVA